MSSYRNRIDNVHVQRNADPETQVKATDQLRRLLKTMIVHPLPEKEHANL